MTERIRAKRKIEKKERQGASVKKTRKRNGNMEGQGRGKKNKPLTCMREKKVMGLVIEKKEERKG